MRSSQMWIPGTSLPLRAAACSTTTYVDTYRYIYIYMYIYIYICIYYANVIIVNVCGGRGLALGPSKKGTLKRLGCCSRLVKQSDWVHIYIYIYILCIYIYIERERERHTQIHIYIYTHIHTCVYIYIYIHMYTDV